VPNSTEFAVSPSSDQMVTSSKSEIALNLSTDGRYLTFMGYRPPVDALDVSKLNGSCGRSKVVALSRREGESGV